jgi:hypothetical protein
VHSKTLWIVLTVLWVLFLLPSAGIAMFAPMMFDAPGSTQSPPTIALFVCVVILPVLWAVGAIAPWIFRNASWSVWLFLIPIADVAAIVSIAFILETFCKGSLTCR